MFIKLIFKKSNIACIGILSLLIVKTNDLAILSGSDSYVKMCFLRCMVAKIAVFLIVAKISYLISSISVVVTYKDYHSQPDRLSC